MQKEKKEYDKRKIQSIEDISNHEGISDKFDELGPKESALADEMQDFEKKVESKKDNTEDNKSEIIENRSTGIESLTEKGKNPEHKKIHLKDKDKDKDDIDKNHEEAKNNLALEDKPLCSFDIPNQSKGLNSGSFSNTEKSDNQNIILIPEEEIKYDSENNLIGKKINRENELQEKNRIAEEEEFNDYFGLDIDDYFNDLNNRDEGDDERLDNSLFNIAEISCNNMRYNTNYSPHIENESEFLSIGSVLFRIYQQNSNINLTSPETNPIIMTNNY